jgi:hypothetical protein
VDPALWALLGVVVGALITGIFSLVSQTRTFAHEKEMHVIKNKGAEAVKAILTEMLNHRSYTDRSFDALKKAVGGYSDDQIRQFLHEVGARRTTRDEDTEEWWYLASRQEERLAKRRRPDA